MKLETLAAVKTDARGDVTFEAVAVDKTKSPNRHGFIFDWKTAADVDIAAWQKNPVLLYDHDSRAYPVGVVDQVVVTARQVKIKARIPNFAADPDLAAVDAEYYAPVRGLVREGLLRAVSIGFYIRAHTTETDPVTGEEIWRIQKLEIIETSIVTIGAHASALINQSDAPECMTALVAAGAVDSDADAGVLFRMSWDAGWRATEYAAFEVADESAEWDAAAEVKAADADRLPQMAALCDGAKGKLIHHYAADCSVAWPGVQAAMGVLLGARGGVQGVDDDVKRAAHTHLAQHYEQFGKAAPEYKAYDKKALKALHDAGDIIIPGAVSDDRGGIDTSGIEARLSAIEAKLETVAERLTAPVPAVPPVVQESAPTPEPQCADVASSLRDALQAVVDGDAQKELRQGLVNGVLASLRTGPGRTLPR